MVRIVLVQHLAVLVVTLIAFLLSGTAGGISAMLGGLSCSLPNALFAFRLHMNTQKPSGPSPAAFFVWEFVKVGLTMVCLYVVAAFYQDLHWLAFIAGVIVVLKSYLFLLFRSQL